MGSDDCDVWFWGWLRHHQRLCRHKDWVDADDVLFYSAWLELFQRMRVTKPEAAEATAQLQIDRPPHPDRHPVALKSAIQDLRRRAAERAAASKPSLEATDYALQDAMALSADCPECQGAGWARRRWRSTRMPFVLTAQLFCRCPAGRRREEADPERGDEKRNFSDLQSLPALWDHSLSHPSWSSRPSPAYHFPGEDGWYLDPGEVVARPTPLGIAMKGSGGSLVRSGRSRWSQASWADETHRLEAYTRREEEAAAGAVPMVGPPAEYPDLSDRAAMPSDPAEAADLAQWF